MLHPARLSYAFSHQAGPHQTKPYTRRMGHPGLLLLLSTLAQPAWAAHWSVNYLNDLPLDTNGFTATELSGVTYLGPAPVAGMHRFLAVQDSGGKLISLDVEFSTEGNLLAAEVAGSQILSPALDYEGIAVGENTVYLSEENNPGVHQLDMATGNLSQSATIPTLFINHKRDNRGFESLTRTATGTTLWTATEEALTVDGPASSATEGTTTRLLSLDITGEALSAGPQYAYNVDPIHAPGTLFEPRSGLSELVALPDGTLLALERSFAVASPTYISSLYEIDFTGATDLRTPPLDEGLTGNQFTPVAKELLWQGQAGGGAGQNLEGLALGPRLSGGNWVLLGVVDDGDPLSNNTVVALVVASKAGADFDRDGDADGSDFLIWQRGFGSSTTFEEGDANGDTVVDDADLTIWQAEFGNQANGDTPQITAVPEPRTLLLLLTATLAAVAHPRRPSTDHRGNRWRI